MMATIGAHQFYKRASSFPATNSLFLGSYDDNMLCRGAQLIQPIDTSFFAAQLSTISKRSSLTASPISDLSSDEDSAVITDGGDEYSEDELPPSPKRRHSGAMSISNEDLPLCYDREALRRETAAHRARQQQHHHHTHHEEQPQGSAPLRQRGRAGTFAAHEQWDSEVAGPSMALWVPEKTGAECKRRRTDKTPSTFQSQVSPQKQVSYIEGPMMTLWGL
ncbi:hypothetical protein VPNG_07076 [Cytospora leucostoma]|uniref:Uncharacterized protein n=1 Tax=Cytospora leucostoma TaxID=1230097 RepID=A0A423WVQ3_9PEZI|nr:hypothetical protein VPNG_07076 [Cytospora leucostoma]